MRKRNKENLVTLRRTCVSDYKNKANNSSETKQEIWWITEQTGLVPNYWQWNGKVITKKKLYRITKITKLTKKRLN